MKVIESPPALEVEVPAGQGDINKMVPMQTHLFRTLCRLPEALLQTYERNPDAEEIAAISAGCSVGAEVDSLLALHSRSEFGGRLSVAGYDTNPKAIEAAIPGHYFLPRVPGYDAEFSDGVKKLERYGFAVDTKVVTKAHGVNRGNGYYQIDARPLRQGQTVTFTGADLSEETPKEKQADLILANNVLYHLQPETATNVIRNLATVLGERGVLSIGDRRPGGIQFRQMGRPGAYSQVRYGQWISQITEQLEEDFDLKPIAFGGSELPTMFSRS